MLRKLAFVVGLLPALWLAQVQALGLGEIDVRSRLNQRFSATIPVVSANPEEVETLTVRLASPADFERGGVERADYLSTLVFSLDPGGHVRVSSQQIAREPLLNFIVEARWRGGKLLREYTVFLDPPTAATATVTESAPVPAPAAVPRDETPAAPVEVTAPPAPARRAPEPAAEPVPAAAAEPAAASAAVGAGSYGPVAPQETLWSIATRLRPSPDVTMDQVLLALYSSNPGAFIGGIGGLQKNVTLQVPDASTMRAVDAETAKARVASLRGQAIPSAPTATKPVPKAAPPKAAVTTAAPASIADRLAEGSVKKAPAADLAPVVTAASPPATADTTARPETATTAKPETATIVKPEVTADATPKSSTATNAVVPTVAAAVPPAPGDAAGNTSATASPPATPATSPPAPAAPAAIETVPASALSNTDDSTGLLLPILAVVVILLLIGLLLWRRRQAAAKVEPMVVLTPKANLRPLPVPPVSTVRSPAAAAGESSSEALPGMRAATTSAAAALPAAAALDGSGSKKTGIDTLLAGGEDFGTVKQAASAPLSVTTDASDPVAEADFHLAYGLYDEAATLLKQAIAKHPARVALQTKLAETYFAAKKPLEFQEAAEAMHGRVSEADWQKVAQMGRQLCPDAQLFKTADSTPSAPDFDLSAFDLPAEPVAVAPTPALAPTIELPRAAPAPVPASTVSLLDFDLEQPEHAAAPLVTPAPDLAAFDRPPAAPSPASNSIEFNLDELDLAQPEAPVRSAGAEDETGTKLDLARAYADMGDNEAARGLLDEVVAGGSPTQKQEAEALLKRLSA